MSKPPVLLPTDAKRQEAIDAYDRAVGCVSRTWNYLHHFLGVFFAVVIDGDIKLVLTEWDSHKSDDEKRKMLYAAIITASPERWRRMPKAPDDLLWVLGLAEGLSDVRNDAAHAVVALEIGAVAMSVAFASQGEREKKLRKGGASLIDEFKKCAEDIDELGVFVAEAFHVLNQPDGGQWPSRPKHIWMKPKPLKAPAAKALEALKARLGPEAFRSGGSSS